MSGSVNRCFMVGRLGTEVEVRYTSSGTPVANFQLATSDQWKDAQGNKKEKVEWHRIVAWGKLAELTGEHLTKGRQVCVEGKLTHRNWTDKNGVERVTTEIQASDVTFLGNKPAEKLAAEEQTPAITEQLPV